MPAIIVCHERSGSHLLADAISHFGGIDVYDEVCNAFTVGYKNKLSIHSFKDNYREMDIEYKRNPNGVNTINMIDAYFNHLSSVSKTNDFVFDLKYGHIGNFDPYWRPPFWKPFLFSYCKNNKVKVIHLFRESVFETVCSQKVANERKIWQIKEEHMEEKYKKYKIDVNSAVEQGLRVRREIDWIKNVCLFDIDHREITYEKMVNSISGDQAELMSIAQYLGLKTESPFAPERKKATASLRGIISNYEDLHAAFSRNGLL